MPVYFVASIGGDENNARNVFQFAKALGVETIVNSPESAALSILDGLANEYGVNLALSSRSRKETPAYWNAESLLKTIAGRSKRVGAFVDVRAWVQDGLDPIGETTTLNDRILGFNLRRRRFRQRRANSRFIR